MELYKEILINVLKDEDAVITFPNLSLNALEIINLKSYQALKAIKRILNDATLSDKECFSKIEEIVSIFESIGSDGGIRHDFG